MFPRLPSYSLPFVRRRREKEEEEEEWNGNVNFEEGNFTEQRVTVKFANNVTGTDKRAKIKGGRRERAERERGGW